MRWLGKEVGTPGKNLPDPLEGKCEEASMFSSSFYMPCRLPANKAVYHYRDDTTYRMCDGCADHNIRNRGGLLISHSSEKE